MILYVHVLNIQDGTRLCIPSLLYMLCLERTLLTTKEDDLKKTEVGYIVHI